MNVAQNQHLTSVSSTWSGHKMDCGLDITTIIIFEEMPSVTQRIIFKFQ